MMWTKLKAKLLCALGAHQWKRAVRVTTVSGTQRCKRCTAQRTVLLRTIKTTPAYIGAPSQWPPTPQAEP